MSSAFRYWALLASFLIPVLPAWASPELDRLYALETIGYLKSIDNVDGLFADYVSSAYQDYFSHQSRFVLQDLSKADTVLGHSKLPYKELIYDPQILAQVARTTRAQSIIRTKVVKEGPQYQFTLQWLHSPAMELMATQTFMLNQQPEDGKPPSLGDVRAELEKALDELIRKVPFSGHVSGRDSNSVTVNLGFTAGLKRGDTLVISTLDEVKKHPLDKSIVEWRLTPIGKVQVEQVDEALSFAKVVEEQPGHSIARYQKVTQIIPAPVAPVQSEPEAQAIAPHKVDLPKLGWVGGGLMLGPLSRQYSTSNNTSGVTGGGLMVAPRGETQIWLTREWFAEMGLGYGFWSHTQQNLTTGANTPAAGVSGNVSMFRIDAGYSYLVNGDMFGTKGWVKLGYRSFSYTLPNSASELTFPITFKSLFLGIGGELPIQPNWGALLNLDFGLFPSASPDVSAAGGANGYDPGSVNSAADAGFFVGGFYRFSTRITLRAVVDVTIESASFSSGNNLSQKMVTFAPELLYYF